MCFLIWKTAISSWLVRRTRCAENLFLSGSSRNYKLCFSYSLSRLKKIVWLLTELRLGPSSSYQNQFSRFITYSLLHFNDMVWYGILMLWYDIPMSWYEVFLKKQNDMKWYAFVWYGMLQVCYWIWCDFPPWTVELFCFAFFTCNVQIDFLYKNTHVIGFIH